ncbi:MAG: hypothetical protein GY705_25340 [Bacteroidetes bacterium]|nr:hypothetical protein [Bacteroidota bacterium]
MELNIPFSDIGYYAGRIVEKAIKKKFGYNAIFFIGQTAISDSSAEYIFINIGTVEQLKKVKQKLADIQTHLEPIIEYIKTKNNNGFRLGLQEAVEIPLELRINMRPKEMVARMDDRYIKMQPLIQHIIKTVVDAV